MIIHPFPPLFDSNSKILILGSFPSVKSREQMFFYGHPQNRFWKVMSKVFEADELNTIEQKKDFLYFHGIALWDVIASCEITGSSDSSIRNVISNDISVILKTAHINQIFVNGKKADKYFKKFISKQIDREAVCLPSTSPANAAWSLDRLVDSWKIIRSFTDNDF